MSFFQVTFSSESVSYMYSVNWFVSQRIFSTKCLNLKSMTTIGFQPLLQTLNLFSVVNPPSHLRWSMPNFCVWLSSRLSLPHWKVDIYYNTTVNHRVPTQSVHDLFLKPIGVSFYSKCTEVTVPSSLASQNMCMVNRFCLRSCILRWFPGFALRISYCA